MFYLTCQRFNLKFEALSVIVSATCFQELSLLYLWTIIEISSSLPPLPRYQIAHLLTDILRLKIEGNWDKSGNNDARTLKFECSIFGLLVRYLVHSSYFLTCSFALTSLILFKVRGNWDKSGNIDASTLKFCTKHLWKVNQRSI